VSFGGLGANQGREQTTRLSARSESIMDRPLRVYLLLAFGITWGAGGLAAQPEAGNGAPGDRPACLSALIEEVVAATTAPGPGTPRSGEKGKAAAPEEPGAPGRGPGRPPDERAPRL
jgi:hypothetical protein